MLIFCLSFPLKASADDWYAQIVPVRSAISLEEAKALGQRMTQWMQDRVFLERELAEIGYDDNKNYAATPQFVLALKQPKPLVWLSSRTRRIGGPEYYMEVAVERQVFYPMEGDIESTLCPACNGSIPEDDAFELINAWRQSPGEAIPCPLCGEKQDISAYIFEPSWGFSALEFRFWYVSDLNESFVKSFAEELGEPVRIVHGGTW